MSSKNYHYPYYPVEPITNLKAMLKRSSEKYAQNLAFVYQDEPTDPLTKITYAQFYQAVTTASNGLADVLQLDPQKRDSKKIAIISPNGYNWALAYYALINLNQIVVPLDWQLPATDLANLITRAGVTAVIYSPLLDDKIIELRKMKLKLKQLISWQRGFPATIGWPQVIERGQALPDTTANWTVYPEMLSTLLFTSGTTAIPKGVMLTQKNLVSSMMGTCQMFDFDQKVSLSVLPLYHSFECTLGLNSQIYQGGTIYYLAGGLHNFAQNLQIAKPTLLQLVPLIVEGSYQRIVTSVKDPHNQAELKKAAKQYFGGRLEKITVGGAPVSPIISQKLEAMGIKVLQGYGITENGPAVTLNRDLAYKNQAAGMPLPNIKVKIHNPDEHGIGEIMIHGPTVTLGYYKDERATDRAIINGWFYTGDCGYFDEDGFLCLTGRKKNIILGKNAKNIYPEEIEFLLNNTPGIKESIVYGKVVHDDVQVAALLVPDQEQLIKLSQKTALELDEQTIKTIIGKQIELVNQHNAPYKAIKSWQVVTSIPRTVTGKIKRN